MPRKRNMWANNSWESPKKMRHTGVILADENLLFPVLYSLPQNTTSVNVTIGFPLRYTSAYQLLIGITRLIRNTTVSKTGNFSFYYKPFVEVLQNPLIQALATDVAQKMLQDLNRRNLTHVPKKYFVDYTLPPLLALICKPPASEAVLFDYFERIFEVLLAAAEKNKWVHDGEYLTFFYRSFQQMREVLSSYKYLSIKGFAKLFKDSMKTLKLPFHGEPLEGLQVMGMLETRTLDFERLIIIGANEGNLPSGRSTNSFIPAELRNFFRLPKEDEKANIIGYHFFRLLKRAKEIDILYNSEVKSGGNAGEKSRYILQLLHILDNKKYQNVQISESAISPTTQSIDIFEIDIPQTEKVHAKLVEKYCGEEGKYALSVTALDTYLQCSLRFYFQYVAELKATRQIDETIDEMTFGEMTHEVMEQLYKPLVKQSVSRKDFLELHHKILDAIKVVFEEHGYGSEDEITGKNFLYRNSIMIKVCERFINQDAELVEKEPFVIELIEPKNKFVHLLKVEDLNLDVRITGNFDRLDKLLEVANSYRIVDYKTGKTGTKSSVEYNTENPAPNKLELQGALYAYLFHNRYPEQNIKVGFYSLKQSGQALKYLEISDKNVPKATENTHSFILIKEIEAFASSLKTILHTVFTQDFVQTQDDKKCLYCDFKTICNRNPTG
jgi:RecB family exonuclease